MEEASWFVDDNKDRCSGQLRWGIEPIATVHGIGPPTYHAAKTWPLSARADRDAGLKPQTLRVWEQSLAVFGANKIWHHLSHNDGIRVARCTVERLIADMGLQGCRRGRVRIRTAEGDERLDRPAGLLERQFRAPAPNQLWAVDLTYVRTHSGRVYVALILDVSSRMVVGWQASRSLRSDLAIDTLEMAAYSRRGHGADLSQLTHHSDSGVQYLRVRSYQRLAHNSLVASGAYMGDCFHNAMAETFDILYKREIIYPKGSWRDVDDVEFATLTYVTWLNNRPLHGEIEARPGLTIPAASEFAFGEIRTTVKQGRNVQVVLLVRFASGRRELFRTRMKLTAPN